MTGQPTAPNVPPSRNKGLIRPSLTLGGGPRLTSHYPWQRGHPKLPCCPTPWCCHTGCSQPGWCHGRHECWCRGGIPSLGCFSETGDAGEEGKWEVTGNWYGKVLLMATRNPVNSPVEVGSWNPIIYRDFTNPRWCRISSINSMSQIPSWERSHMSNLKNLRKKGEYIQGGPLLVINGVINPINGLIIG